jgi:hypothetical protein
MALRFGGLQHTAQQDQSDESAFHHLKKIIRALLLTIQEDYHFAARFCVSDNHWFSRQFFTRWFSFFLGLSGWPVAPLNWYPDIESFAAVSSVVQLDQAKLGRVESKRLL